MQHVNDSDFISTSHSFLEVVLKVLHTELPTYHLTCNTECTQGVRHACLCVERVKN